MGDYTASSLVLDGGSIVDQCIATAGDKGTSSSSNTACHHRHSQTVEYVKENTDYSSVDELAIALFNEETTLKESGLKPIFRLSPPRKGYESTRTPYSKGGSLGYRSENINELLEKMI